MYQCPWHHGFHFLFSIVVSTQFQVAASENSRVLAPDEESVTCANYGGLLGRVGIWIFHAHNLFENDTGGGSVDLQPWTPRKNCDWARASAADVEERSQSVTARVRPGGGRDSTRYNKERFNTHFLFITDYSNRHFSFGRSARPASANWRFVSGTGSGDLSAIWRFV